MIIELKLESKDVSAKAEYNPQTKKIKVLKGSSFRKNPVKSMEKHNQYYFQKRKDFLELGYLNDNYILINDYEFDNPRLASSIILGRLSNSRKDWKTLNGQTLDDVNNYDVNLLPDDQKFEQLKLFLEDIDILNNLNDEVGFNIFRTLNIVNNEIRHSNVIAWLLDPYETHKLKDEFTKLLVRDIYSQNKLLYKDANLENVFLWDFSDIKIFREKDHIDILILDEKNAFILAIENKLRSKEHDNQLTRYKKLIYDRYPKSKFKHMFTYLTIEDEEPSDVDWGSYSYNSLVHLIEKLTKQVQGPIKLFLDNYIEIIRRDIMTDDKVMKLCQDIYAKHKSALDLIFQYKPDVTSEMSDIIKESIESYHDYNLKHSVKNYVRFSSSVLDPINDKYKAVDAGWVKEKSVILHEIRIRKFRIIITTVVGPTTDDSRLDIIKHYQTKTNEEIKVSPKWTTLKTTNIIKYTENDEISEILDRLESKLIATTSKHVADIDKLFLDFK